MVADEEYEKGEEGWAIKCINVILIIVSARARTFYLTIDQIQLWHNNPQK